MTAKDPRRPYVPPRWFVRTAWVVHRRIHKWSGGRRGLWLATPDKWGALSLTTIGRRSGQPRTVILGYFMDGPNCVTMAMNGWGAAEPAWWLNLQANPKADVRLKDEHRAVVAHAATGDERDRLWARWKELNEHLDGYAARRPGETAIVVLTPDPT